MKLFDFVPLNKINFLTEAVKTYNTSDDFKQLQASINNSINLYRNKLLKAINGKRVAFRGAKGFGQLQQKYIVDVENVDIVLYQDRYTILIKGVAKNERKTSEFYVDPSNNSIFKIKLEEPTPRKSTSVDNTNVFNNKQSLDREEF